MTTSEQKIVPTPVKALRKLADEGKFVSVLLGLPHTVVSHDWEIKLDGEKITEWVSEAYAPEPGAPESGWVVVYLAREEGEWFTGETEVKYGNVEIIDLGEHTNDDAQKTQEIDESDVGSLAELDIEAPSTAFGDAPCGVFRPDGDS